MNEGYLKVEYYLALKKYAKTIHTTTWMILENTMRSKRGQTRKVTCIIPLEKLKAERKTAGKRGWDDWKASLT